MLTSLVLTLALKQSNPIDTIVQKHLEKGLLGVGVAVVKDGKIVHLKSYGKGQTPKHDGHYRLASITKQFTAGVIVRLVSEKKLAYEDTLGKFMPDTPTAWHPVTVRQLLTHTSGIPSYTDSPKFGPVVLKPTTPDGIWQLVKDTKVDFAPGSKYNYNNTAYCLLGSIIERTTKKGFYEALDSYILRPAGMKSTGSEKKFKPVPSFDPKGNASFQLNMDWPYSAGALVSTLGDMAKWDIALRGQKLFTEAEKQLMFNPDPATRKLGENYGFGWHATYVDDKLYSYSHTGGIPGFSTIIERTANGVTTIVLANHEYEGIVSLRTEIRDYYDPMPKPKSAPDTAPELTAKHRKMIEELVAGRCDESLFSPDFLKKVPASVLLSTSKRFDALGPLSEFTLTKSEGKDPMKRTYRLVFGSSPLTLVVVTQDGLINGMLLN